MNEKPKMVPAFDMEDIRRWERNFEMNAPSAKDRTHATDNPAVISMRSQASKYGVAFRIRLADGTEQSIFLNPLVARAMMLEILQIGEESGWMPNPQSIAAPLIPPALRKKV